MPFEENTPGDPYRIAPKDGSHLYNAALQTITLPRMSFAIFTFEAHEANLAQQGTPDPAATTAGQLHPHQDLPDGLAVIV